MSVIELSDELLDAFVAGGYSLVEFSFGEDPDGAAGRAADAFARQYAGRVKVGRVNVPLCPLAGTWYRITQPQLLLFVDGEVIDRVIGAWRGEYAHLHDRLGGRR